MARNQVVNISITYTDNAYEIQKGASELRNDYHAYTKGHSFTTHNYDQMLNGFAQMYSFVNGNYIVYDRYAEFILQVEQFTESIFAALALRETNSYVIREFIDYHIHRLIFDGDHRITWRYFNKYLLKSIPYKKNNDDHFIKLIGNILKNNHLVKAAYKAYSPEEGSTWRNRYPAIFTNCVCLAAMIEMEDTDVERIVREIMVCYAKGDLPSPDAYEQINSFFSSKRTQLSTDLIKEMIVFFLPFCDQYLQLRLGILIAELKTRKKIIDLSVEQQKRVIDFSFNETELRHFNTAVYFHAVVKEPFRREITKRIIKILRAKFDTYNYYYSAINDVLSFQGSEFCEKFVEVTFPDPAKHSFRKSFYGPEDNGYPLFDMLFNLCFKHNLLPRDLSGKNFFGFGDYYDWLLDIDGFNYTKFKVSWLGLNATKFYFQEFRKHKVIKLQMEKYLRNNRDLRAERLYFDIFNPSNKHSEEDCE